MFLHADSEDSYQTRQIPRWIDFSLGVQIILLVLSWGGSNFILLQDVVNSLQEKLNLKCVQHFNLVLHNVKSHMPGRMTLLQEHETVAEVIISLIAIETL